MSGIKSAEAHSRAVIDNIIVDEITGSSPSTCVTAL